jgi:hypothetical protein
MQWYLYEYFAASRPALSQASMDRYPGTFVVLTGCEFTIRMRTRIQVLTALLTEDGEFID